MRKYMPIWVILSLTALLLALSGAVAQAEEEIIVSPRVSLVPDSGPAGSQVTIKMTDFFWGGRNGLTWVSVEHPDEYQYLGEFVIDENRDFEYEFTVPDVAPGDYIVSAGVIYDPCPPENLCIDDPMGASAVFHVTEPSPDREFNRSNNPDPAAAGTPSGNRGGYSDNPRSVLPSTGSDFVGVGAFLFLSLFTGLMLRRVSRPAS